MQTQLPLTSDEFCKRLQDLGLIARDALVTEISIYARYGEAVTMHVTTIPDATLTGALK